MKTFDDGGCIYKVSSTQDAHEVRVELCNLYPSRPMHIERKDQQSLRAKEGKVKQSTHEWRAQGGVDGGDHLDVAAVCFTVSKQHRLLCWHKNKQQERSSVVD